MKPLDAGKAKSGSESETHQDRFDADFTLMTADVGLLPGALPEALGGESAASP